MYNLPVALGLRGQLDVPTLGRAFGELLRRHEVLRTSFGEEGGVAVQILHPAAPEGSNKSLPVVDLTALEPAARHAERDRCALAEAARPFDLAHAPLLRLRLVRTTPEENLLLATMHHVISDAWSIGVMVREAVRLYNAFTADPATPASSVLPELTVQYADFARWQREWLSGTLLEAEIDWWREQLEGVSALELPTDRPRPAVVRGRGANHRFALPPGLTDELEAGARSAGATLFMTLLATFEVLVARWSGRATSPSGRRSRDAATSRSSR